MPVERAAGIILYRNSSEGRKYLIIRASRREAQVDEKTKVKEFWDFPKGRLEEKETGIEAARRESKEEVGIEDIEISSDFKKTVQYFTWREGKRIPKFVAMFLGETKKEDYTLSWEHDKAEWLSYTEAHERISLLQMKKVLEQAEHYLIANESR
jgi:8-oxo-dGTP pyrophosphatase MutT (NUDIX family)